MATFTQHTLGDGELSDAAKWYWRILKPLSDALASLIGDTAWTVATLQNSWVDHAYPTYAHVSYRIRGGVLYMRGAAEGGANVSIMFSLPAAYRPSLTRVVLATGVGVEPARLTINPGGSVVYQGNGSGTAGAVWLDGVSVAL